MKTPILGASYLVRSVNAAADRLVNLYPEPIPQGGKEPLWLTGTPGKRLVATLGNGPIRGEQAATYNGVESLYVVSDNTLYKLDTAYGSSSLGSISPSALVSMAWNGTQLFVAANPNGYIYSTVSGAFAQITDPDFQGASSVCFLNGYFVYTIPNSQQFAVTSLYDGASVDPLDFASAEGSPDALLSCLADHGELWLFGSQSVEVWADSGGADFPFQRIPGAFIEQGCAAAFSPASGDNSIFWLGQDTRGKGIVWRANGYVPQRISTHAVEYAIGGYANIADAFGYCYQQEGHLFYVLTFPSARATWCYDAATGLWHERGYFDTQNDMFSRDLANCHQFFNGVHVVGDYRNGKLYALDLDYFTDNEDTIKRIRAWRALPSGANNFNRTFQHELQIMFQSGVGLNSGQGSDPQAMLRWSDDGGHTWGNIHSKGMGKIGRSGQRVIWRRLGSTEMLRDRVYELSITDPVKVAIMGAELNLSGAAS